MKWKIYAIANVLSFISAAAFLVFMAYMIFIERSVPEMIPIILMVFSCVSMIMKALLSMHYQRKLHQAEGYFISYKWLYIVLIIIQLILTGFISYGLYMMTKNLSEVRADWTFAFGLTDFITFVLSAAVVMLLDFSLLKRLKKLSDLSTGILEESEPWL